MGWGMEWSGKGRRGGGVVLMLDGEVVVRGWDCGVEWKGEEGRRGVGFGVGAGGWLWRGCRSQGDVCGAGMDWKCGTLV